MDDANKIDLPSERLTGFGRNEDSFRDCRKSPLDKLSTFFMGHLTFPDLKIVDSGPFYEVVLCS
jgi:hypothetical protein